MATQEGREPFLTGPNLLTLSRLPLAGLVWLSPLSPVYVLGLMAAAGATDVADGWLERRLLARQGRSLDTPTIGIWLDPLCDKIFALSVLAAVAAARRPPLWLLPLVVTREIIQGLAVLAWRLVPAVRARLRYRFRSAALGKAATASQFLAIAAMMSAPRFQAPLAVVTGVLGAWAGLFYVRRAWRGSPGEP